MNCTFFCLMNSTFVILGRFKNNTVNLIQNRILRLLRFARNCEERSDKQSYGFEYLIIITSIIFASYEDISNPTRYIVGK
jgi:hypothetical protein